MTGCGISLQNTRDCIASVGFSAGFGAAATFFYPVHPIGGAIFGATATMGKYVVDQCLPSGTSNVTRYVVNFLIAIGTGFAMTNLMGFSLSFVAATGLHLTMIGIFRVAEVVITGRVPRLTLQKN
jgi:hypothetical protein